MGSSSKQRVMKKDPITPVAEPMSLNAKPLEEEDCVMLEGPPKSASMAEEDWEEQHIKRASALAVEELIRRRGKMMRKLGKHYRRLFWANMMDVRYKYREYYWKYGKSGLKEDDGENVEGSDVAVQPPESNENGMEYFDGSSFPPRTSDEGCFGFEGNGNGCFEGNGNGFDFPDDVFMKNDVCRENGFGGFPENHNVCRENGFGGFPENEFPPEINGRCGFLEKEEDNGFDFSSKAVRNGCEFAVKSEDNGFEFPDVGLMVKQEKNGFLEKEEDNGFGFSSKAVRNGCEFAVKSEDNGFEFPDVGLMVKQEKNGYDFPGESDFPSKISGFLGNRQGKEEGNGFGYGGSLPNGYDFADKGVNGGFSHEEGGFTAAKARLNESRFMGKMNDNGSTVPANGYPVNGVPLKAFQSESERPATTGETATAVPERTVETRCGFSGCKTKPMAFSSHCHTHILLDIKQQLYKPCIYLIKSAQSGQITCGKPVLRSTVPRYCGVHFSKAQRYVARALRKAGLNASLTNKPPPKFHLIIAEGVRAIQAERRDAKKLQRSQNIETTPVLAKTVKVEVAD